ncbi:MAG: hypothetical protein ALECFALPRED_005905 [Alectoria fallacina]|uniref:Uncharacterized protein n=1 Tax=Alectoria fallacina TaxID=1903189 RepID=A0A8H3INB4_9LECA|nr:MAG: hypothetical protein ALECFALPRED_005905 [Alectoria fallacina]
MSRFQARWTVVFTSSLLAFSLPTNGVPLTSALPACPSAPSSFHPPASCCNLCSIQASQVTVNFWSPEATPTTQAPSETPYTLVSDGFTFTSPSVYVMYKDIFAQGDCTNYEEGQIGTSIRTATIAYDPAALSTAACVQNPSEQEFIVYGAIDYSGWANPVPNSVEETRAGCFIPNTSGLSPAGTNLAANPAFSIPLGLSSLQPIWSSFGCQPDSRDPAYQAIPKVLTKTSVQKHAGPTKTASPAALLTSPIVTPTGVNSAQPTV